ncbi:nuclear transport factor 2 family protein [Streptodolium elevatio]|uniref:Nuclear transport factor 2 family protein n=1 Tax=Streptodolium elevatio TaxID=3157996 RepID=A0ABV3DFL6_9ACTN
MQENTARSAIDMFIAALNTSSDNHAVELLSRALTSDVVFWGPLGRSDGVDALERFVLDMRRHPAGPGTMLRCSEVDAPGEWARYQWLYRMPGDGTQLTGTDVVHLRRDRIDQMIVFAGA